MIQFIEAIDAFLQYAFTIDRSSATIQGYRNDLLYFHRYLEEHLNGIVYLDQVTVDDIEQYLSYLREEKKYAPSSLKRKLACYCTFYKYCVRKRLAKVNIAQEVMPIRVKSVERTYLKEDEVRQLVDEIDHPLIQLVVQTLFYTGMRISECMYLTMEDVDFEQNIIRVIEGKGGKDRILPMNHKLRHLLLEYRNHWRPRVDSPYFFCTLKSGMLHRNYVNMIIQQTLKRLGWNRKITAHTMRHSFASSLVQKEVNIVKIQKLLGHSSLVTTSVYTHTNIDELSEAVNQL
jgi:integrase/recombinase XerD